MKMFQAESWAINVLEELECVDCFSPMFVARVQGKSMEPDIPDGAYCLFRSPRPGSRQGRHVRVTLKPLNPDFEEITLTPSDEDDVG